MTDNQRINFERENERLLVVLKRIFRRLEMAEEENIHMAQDLALSSSYHEMCDSKILQLQTENDELRLENASLLTALDAHRMRTDTMREGRTVNNATTSEQHFNPVHYSNASALDYNTTTTPPCIKCKIVHPMEAVACSLWDAVRANDVPSTRAYTTTHNIGDLDQCNGGYTPLRWAAAKGFVKVAELLLRAGAKHERAGSYGAIHSACTHGHTSVVRLLRLYGIGVNLRSAEGFTPLHIASWTGKADTVRFLLENNADATLTNNRNQTALDLAKWFDQRAVVRILNQHARRAMAA